MGKNKKKKSKKKPSSSSPNPTTTSPSPPSTSTSTTSTTTAQPPSQAFRNLPSYDSPSYLSSSSPAVSNKEVVKEERAWDFGNDCSNDRESLEVEGGTEGTTEDILNVDGRKMEEEVERKEVNEEEVKEEEEEDEKEVKEGLITNRKSPLTTPTFTSTIPTTTPPSPSPSSDISTSSTLSYSNDYSHESNTSSIANTTLTPCSSIGGISEEEDLSGSSHHTATTTTNTTNNQNVEKKKNKVKRLDRRASLSSMTSVSTLNSTVQRKYKRHADAIRLMSCQTSSSTPYYNSIIGEGEGRNCTLFENLDKSWYGDEKEEEEEEERLRVELERMCLACAAVLFSDASFLEYLPFISRHLKQQQEEEEEEEEENAPPVIPKSILYYAWSTLLLSPCCSPYTTLLSSSSSITKLLSSITNTLTSLKYLTQTKKGIKITHAVYVQYGIYILEQKHEGKKSCCCLEEVVQQWHLQFGRALEKLIVEEEEEKKNGGVKEKEEEEVLRCYAALYTGKHVMLGCAKPIVTTPSSSSCNVPSSAASTTTSGTTSLSKEEEKKDGDSVVLLKHSSSPPQEEEEEEEEVYKSILDLFTNTTFLAFRMTTLISFPQDFSSLQTEEEEEEEREMQRNVLFPTRVHIQDLAHFSSLLEEKEKEEWEEEVEQMIALWEEECTRQLHIVRGTTTTTPTSTQDNSSTALIHSSTKKEEEEEETKPEELNTVNPDELHPQLTIAKQLSSSSSSFSQPQQYSSSTTKRSSLRPKQQQRFSKPKTKPKKDKKEPKTKEEEEEDSDISYRGGTFPSSKEGSSSGYNRRFSTASTSTTKKHANVTTTTTSSHRRHCSPPPKKRNSTSSTTTTTFYEKTKAMSELRSAKETPVTLDKVLQISLTDLWAETSIARSYHELSTLYSSSSSSSSSKRRKLLSKSIELYAEITTPLSYLLSSDLRKVQEEDLNRVNVASGKMPFSTVESTLLLQTLRRNVKEAGVFTNLIHVLAADGWAHLGKSSSSSSSSSGGIRKEVEVEDLECFRHALHLLDISSSSSSSKTTTTTKTRGEIPALTHPKKSLAASILHQMAILHYDSQNYTLSQKSLKECIVLYRNVLSEFEQQQSQLLRLDQTQQQKKGEKKKKMMMMGGGGGGSLKSSKSSTTGSKSSKSTSSSSSSSSSKNLRKMEEEEDGVLEESLQKRLAFYVDYTHHQSHTPNTHTNTTKTDSSSSTSSSSSTTFITKMEQSLSTSLEYLALCYHAENSYASSLSLFQEALLLRTIHSGKNSLDVASLQYNMGVVHDDMGQHEASLGRYNESLRTRYNHYIQYCKNYSTTTTTTQNHVPFEPKMQELEESIILTLNCMGYVYQLLNDLDNAISCYVKVADIFGSRYKRKMLEQQGIMEEKERLEEEKEVFKSGFGGSSSSSFKNNFPPAFASLFPELVLDEVRIALVPQEKTNTSVGAVGGGVDRRLNKSLRVGVDMLRLVGGSTTTPAGTVQKDDEDGFYDILKNEADACTNLVYLLQRKKHGNFDDDADAATTTGQTNGQHHQPYRSTTAATTAGTSNGSRSLAFALKTSNEEEIESSDDCILMNASYRLGQIYIQFGQWDKSVENMEQALRSAWTLKPASSSTNSSTAISGESGSCTDEDGASSAGYSSGSQSKRHEWRKHKSSNAETKKDGKIKTGNNNNSKEDNGKGYKEEKFEEDVAEEGKIYYALALSHAALGDHERAIRYYTTSLRYAKEQKGSDSLEVARILYLHGLSCWRLAEWEKSGLLWGDCLRILLRSRDSAVAVAVAATAGVSSTTAPPAQSSVPWDANKDGSKSALDFQIAIVLYSVAASKCALGHCSDQSTLTCLNDAQSNLSSVVMNDSNGRVSCYLANTLFYQAVAYIKKASEVPLRLQRVENGTTLNDLIIATDSGTVAQTPADESWEGMLHHIMSCLNDAFALYKQHSLFPDAESISIKEKVPAEMTMVPRANRLVVAHIRYMQGQVHDKLGLYESAMMYYGVALRWYQRLYGRRNIYAASVLNSMGGLCSAVGGERNHIIALQCYDEALRFRQDLLGVNHTSVASTLGALAAVCTKLGMYERAMPLYDDSLKIYLANEGREGRNVAKTLLFMGIVNARHGQYERAMDYLQGAIRIRKYLVGYCENVIRVSGGSSRAITSVPAGNGLHLADSMTQSGINRDEEIKQELYDEEMELSIVSYNMGNVYLKLGELKMALDCFEEMLEIRRRHCGAPKNTIELLDYFLDAHSSTQNGKGPDEEDLSSIADALHNCGCCYFFLKQFERALSCYNEALVIKGTLCRRRPKRDGSKTNLSIEDETRRQNNKMVRFSGSADKRSGGPTHQGNTLTYATTLKSIGAVHSKLTNYDMALQHYETALQIQRSHLGYDHIVVAGTLSDMGHLLRRTNYRSDIAVKCYKESLRISKIQLGSDHEDVANLLYNLGYVYDSMHRYQHAVSCYRECVRVYGRKYSQGLLYRLLRCRGNKKLCNEEERKESVSRDVRFEEYQTSSDQSSHTESNDSRENYHRVLGALKHATQQAGELGGSVTWSAEDYCRIKFEAIFLQFLEFLSDYVVDPTRNVVNRCANNTARSLEQASSNAVVTARDTMAYNFLYLIQE